MRIPFAAGSPRGCHLGPYFPRAQYEPTLLHGAGARAAGEAGGAATLCKALSAGGVAVDAAYADGSVRRWRCACVANYCPDTDRRRCERAFEPAVEAADPTPLEAPRGAAAGVAQVG